VFVGIAKKRTRRRGRVVRHEWRGSGTRALRRRRDDLYPSCGSGDADAAVDSRRLLSLRAPPTCATRPSRISVTPASAGGVPGHRPGAARRRRSRPVQRVVVPVQGVRAGSVLEKYGFDRHWRNARTLSLHQPARLQAPARRRLPAQRTAARRFVQLAIRTPRSWTVRCRTHVRGCGAVRERPVVPGPDRRQERRPVQHFRRCPPGSHPVYLIATAPDRRRHPAGLRDLPVRVHLPVRGHQQPGRPVARRASAGTRPGGDHGRRLRHHQHRQVPRPDDRPAVAAVVGAVALFWLVLSDGRDPPHGAGGLADADLSFTTCTIPGFLLLLGEWGHVGTLAGAGRLSPRRCWPWRRSRSRACASLRSHRSKPRPRRGVPVIGVVSTGAGTPVQAS